MFIGEKEVKTIDENKVTFVDGTEVEYTARQLEYIVTEESKDATKYRDLVNMHFADDVLKNMKEHNLPKGYINSALSLVVHSHEMMFATAIGKAFGTFEEDKHPAMFEENVTMADIEKFNN